MEKIKSPKKLSLWLKDKPDDWAQALGTRAALRSLPHAFATSTPDGWIQDYALSLFRALAITWVAGSERHLGFQNAANEASNAANSAAEAAVSARGPSRDAAFAVAKAAAVAGSRLDNAVSTIDSAAKAAEGAAVRFVDYTYRLGDPLSLERKAFRADQAALQVQATVWSSVWFNFSADCDWLVKSNEPATNTSRLAREPMWLSDAPDGWDTAWQDTKARLLKLDPTYQVWIDWYDRRIDGHDEAFDIPGDIDRIEDKKILARLANATDEDFWGKGATYVNTTLQDWIDKARARTAPLPDFEAMQRQIAAGAVPRYGSDGERERRAALQRQIDALSHELEQLDPPPAPIGHNCPPLELEEAGVEDASAVVQEVRILVPSLEAEIAPAAPDPQRVLSILSRLASIVQWVGKKAVLFIDEALKKAGMVVGLAGGGWLIAQFPSMKEILKTAAEWLQPLLPML